MRVRIFILLLYATGVYAAAPSTLPVAPAVQTVPALPVRTLPRITGYSPVGCIGKGTVLNIVGSGFGATPGARGVALGGQGIHVDLPVEAWSDTRLRVRLPEIPKIQAGQWYYAGVEQNDHSRWLSNIDRNFQVCEGGAVLSRSLTVPAPVTAPVLQPAPATGGGQTPVEPVTVGNGTTAAVVPGSGGSLVGAALPPAPQVSDATTTRTETDENIEPGELLVVSGNLQQALQLQDIAQQLAFTIKRRRVLAGLGLVVTTLGLTADTSPAQAIATLRTQAPDVWVDFNHRLALQGDDAKRGYPARLVSWPPHRADCGRGLRIGIVDGSLPEQHPALQGVAITRKDFVTHGVAVAPPGHALTIAAILVGRGATGLVPAASLYVAEVMRQRDRKHVDTNVEWLVQALDWLVQQHVDVMNLSLGGPHNLILEAAIGRVLGTGIPVVAAAGNDGPDADPLYPAAQEGVIAVTAVDADQQIYRKANRGSYIRFAAPGVDVWAPGMEQDAYVSGTSFAAPFVTAALVATRQAEPRAAWPELLQQLERAARDLGAPGRDTTFGAGLIQGPASCGAPG
jgi:Subtilase family